MEAFGLYLRFFGLLAHRGVDFIAKARNRESAKGNKGGAETTSGHGSPIGLFLYRVFVISRFRDSFFCISIVARSTRAVRYGVVRLG
jgi:hypothetical protein